MVVVDMAVAGYFLRLLCRNGAGTLFSGIGVRGGGFGVSLLVAVSVAVLVFSSWVLFSLSRRNRS